MKKRIKRNENIVLIFLCCLISATGNAQTHSTVKDTVYVFMVRGTLENDCPIISYAVVKDLSSLHALTTIISMDSFVCEFLRHSILFEEPFFTLSRNESRYNFSNDKERKCFLKKLTKKITRANKDYQYIKSKKISNGKSIEFSCLKLCGEFWIIPKTKEELNSYSHSFEVRDVCYDKTYIYNLKDIDNSCKISKEDIEKIEKYIK